MRRFIFFILGVFLWGGLEGRDDPFMEIDKGDDPCITFSLREKMIQGYREVIPPGSLEEDTIRMGVEEASGYIEGLLEVEDLWRPEGEEMRTSLKRLLFHFQEPFDSVGSRLRAFEYDSVGFGDKAFVHHRSVALLWLNDSSFVFDHGDMTRDPHVFDTVLVDRRSLNVLLQDSLPQLDVLMDSIFQEPDTLVNISIDSLYLESMGLQLYGFEGGHVSPPLLDNFVGHAAHFTSDSGKIVFSDTTWAIVADGASPFYILPNELLADSLEAAVSSLLAYTMNRDSIPLYINDINGRKTPMWVGSGDDNLYRYWVKNFKNDSITIWVGNPSRNNLTVYLEDDVNINRMTKQVVNDVPFTLAVPETALAKLEPLKTIPDFWEFDVSTNFAFSQTYLSNWSKGGQSALTTLLDIKGSANYINNTDKTKWLNSGRLKYGSIIADEQGLRKNTDIMELNSKYNSVLKGKFDFSATFYMKNQIAGGYSYPNDSTVNKVSKFLNPATFTVGLGVEYKPFKHTQLNFSPLSYKNTFVLDTTSIFDYTSHGIERGKMSKQEMGSQVVMTNKLNVLDGLEVNNSLRLFASYFDKPMSVDMDWEVNLKKQITWFFTVSANFHLIWDRDIKFAVLDDDGEAVMVDGVALKEPKVQFKEFVGLSFAFNF